MVGRKEKEKKRAERHCGIKKAEKENIGRGEFEGKEGKNRRNKGKKSKKNKMIKKRRQKK